MTDNEKLQLQLLKMKLNHIYKHQLFILNASELKRLREYQKKVSTFSSKVLENESFSEEDKRIYEKLNESLDMLVYKRKEMMK